MPSLIVYDALDRVAKQTGHHLLVSSELAENLTSTALQGQYTVTEALAKLLDGTGLSGSLTEHGVIVVRYPEAHKNTNYGEEMMKNRKNVLAATVAFFMGGGSAQVVFAEEGGEEKGWMLEEVVVTATKRETSLNDTALSVTALSGEAITRGNITEMNDYLRTVPGVNFVDQGVGRNGIVIRGISVDPELEAFVSSPAVGIYFGEVALSGLSITSGSSDLKMIDLERVEVLRGPQGTLFGASSLAGAVRNIPVAPDLNELGGSIKTGYSHTAKEGGDNTKVEGVLNIPLIEDVLAIRAVGYRYDTSGYIKNVAGSRLASGGDSPVGAPGVTIAEAVENFGGAELYRDDDDIGSSSHTGGRLSVLWAPTDDLDLTLTHVYQDAEQEGIPFSNLFAGDYSQVELAFGDIDAPNKNGLGDEINITNLILEYNLGDISLLSSSAWVKDDSYKAYNVGSFFSGAPTVQPPVKTSEVFSQEVRAISDFRGPLQFVAGIYYEEFESETDFSTYATGDLSLFPLGTSFGDDNPLVHFGFLDRSIDQLAIYGEVSYEITEKFEFTLGARRYDYSRLYDTGRFGIFGDAGNAGEVEESGTNFKANLSYRPDDDTHYYLRWAEGFRLGDYNLAPVESLCDVNNDGILDGTSAPITDNFESDTTENFEFGAKLTLLEQRMQVNAAIYRVDWMGIPLRVIGGKLPEQDLRTCFASVVVNAGEARSQGFEIETQYQLTENLNINFGGSYVDSELTEDAPSIGGQSGDRLASSPEYTFTLGSEYEFELAGHPSYIRGDYSYIGEFYNKIGETGNKGGGYGQYNMSAGVELEDFSVEVYGHNLSNDNAITSAGTLESDDRVFRLRPRTIGLTVGYRF